MLVGCGGWEKLPSFKSYYEGTTVVSNIVQTDGFYVSGLTGSVFHTKGEPVRRWVGVQCFYSDGAYFHAGFDCHDEIDSVLPTLRRFLNTDWGRRNSTETGLFWGLYTTSGDTVLTEDFFPINGEHRAVLRTHKTLSDTSVICLSWVAAHRQGFGIRDKPRRPDRPIPAQFVRSEWKPDSTEFLRTRTDFLRSQGVVR